MSKDYLKTKPAYRSSVKLTDREYAEFISAFGYALNEQKRWFNDAVLKDGLKFPWTMDEIDMSLKVDPGSMAVKLAVNANSADFFEDEFWDEDWKKKEYKRCGRH